MANQLPQRVLGLRLQVASGPHWLDVLSGAISENTWHAIAERIFDVSRIGTCTVDGVRYRWIP